MLTYIKIYRGARVCVCVCSCLYDSNYNYTGTHTYTEKERERSANRPAFLATHFNCLYNICAVFRNSKSPILQARYFVPCLP